MRPKTLAGASGIRRIALHGRMLRVEPAGCRIDHVAAFRDRERDDADCRIGERADQRGAFGRRHEVDHRPGHRARLEALLLLDDGGEIVLAGEGLPHGFVERHDAGADDGPVVVAAQVEQIVEIDAEMGAMKIADAEMHDARRQIGRVR